MAKTAISPVTLRKGDKRGDNCRSRFEGNRLSLNLKMNTQDSICCGATINYQDFCSECGEHTGAIQFEDADGTPVMQYVQPDGMLSDKRYGDDNCCGECFVTSHDVPRGHVWVAVPEGCGDEDCECHIPECGKCRMLGDLAPCDECYSNGMPYEPNFNGFISTVTGKEIATIGLVVLMFVSIWFAV